MGEESRVGLYVCVCVCLFWFIPFSHYREHVRDGLYGTGASGAVFSIFFCSWVKPSNERETAGADDTRTRKTTGTKPRLRINDSIEMGRRRGARDAREGPRTEDPIHDYQVWGFCSGQEGFRLECGHCMLGSPMFFCSMEIFVFVIVCACRRVG